jgi:hypothetical protein
MTICNLTGTLTDSAGTPLSGRLDVRLDGYLSSDLTTPDTIYTQQTHEFLITAGNVAIALRESETKRVSYRFRFYAAEGTGYALTPLIDFHAVVPNVVAYEFAALLPTGITNDTLATGALRVARAIFETPSLINLVSSALKITRQATPPIGSANEVWIKTTDGSYWFWNGGQARWQSAPQTSYHYRYWDSGVSVPITLVAQDDYFNPPAPYDEIWLTRIDYRWKILTGFSNASNYWRFRGQYKLASSANPIAITPAPYHNSEAAPVNAIGRVSENVNIVFNADDLDYLASRIESRTGTPGGLNLWTAFTYYFLHP